MCSKRPTRWSATAIHIIHLEVGEPDFDAPACVKSRGLPRATTDGHTHYTHSLGNSELREAICRHYRDTYGVDVHPDRSSSPPGPPRPFCSCFRPCSTRATR